MKVEALLSRLEGVKQTTYGAADWLARCPAHADRTPSLHVSLDRDRNILLHCFAGCPPENVVESLGLTMGDLFSGEGPAVYVPPTKKDYKKPAPAPAASSPHPHKDRAWRWLEGRGVNPTTARNHGVTGDNRALYFPFYRDGEHINTQTRFLDPKGFKMEPDCEITWFGLDDARTCVEKGATRLFIVEGLVDWLTVKQAHPGAAVLSVPNGASAREMEWFDDAESLFQSVDKVIVAVDSDGPGQKLEAELIRRIGPEMCQRVKWAEGCNDANDVLVKQGEEALFRVLDSAYDIPIDGIISPLDITDDFLRLYRHGLQRGLTTGWKELDPFLTILTKHIYVITGVPNSGKSSFLDALAVNMSMYHQWKWAMFSPESSPIEEHLSRWAELLVDAPFFDGPTPKMTEKDAVYAQAWAAKHLRFLAPVSTKLDDILEMARIEVRRNGINALVIDPWNEIDDEMGNQRDDRYLSAALRKIRRFAEQHDIAIFIVNHPHAVHKDKETKQYPVIDFYDLHGGSMRINKMSVLISIWRDSLDQSQPVQVHVKKTKTRRIGRKGMIPMAFNRITGRYKPVGEGTDGG